MDDRAWKNISIALGVVCALLLGVAGALMIAGQRGGSSSPTASGLSAGSPTDSGASPDGASPSSSDSSTPEPSRSLGPASPATVTFTGLGLDSQNSISSQTGQARTFTFTSEGAGPVSFIVTKISGGTARMCADVDNTGVHCKDSKSGALTGFSLTSDPTPNHWTVTLYGYGPNTPTVDVKFTWPAVNASIILQHGRFEQTPEGYNGFAAKFQPRTAGNLDVSALWTNGNARAAMSLSTVSNSSPASSPVPVSQSDYVGVTFVSPNFTAAVDQTRTYEIKLRRSDAPASGQVPDLTAEIKFP